MFALLPIISQAQQIDNIASNSGIGSYCTGLYGNGLSFFDWDSDGYDDIVLLDDQFSVQFFKNSNGTFEQVDLPGVEVNGAVNSVNWVDFNNDKEPDLAFNLAPGTFKLFVNNGDFQFTDISASCGIDQVQSMGYGQAWADYDKDGFLDLYICNYQTNQVMPQRTNYLYHNNGDGTFSNTTTIAGVGDGFKTTFIAVWMDFDKDTWPDLFVFNDRYQFENSAYRNNGDGTFTDVSETIGFDGAYEPMSATVGDFNNDGNLDIYSTNTQGNKLYENSGQGTFSEVAASNNVQMFISTWGASWIDIDGDTKDDLIVASAAAFGNYNNIYYLHNTGFGFETIQNYGFGDSYGQSYSLAIGDINNDGHQEILCHGAIGVGTQLWQTSGFNYTYLKINLNGIISNRDAVGSWIEAYSNGVVQTKYTMSGEQYLSQNSQWEFFGFNEDEQIDSLIVRWPSGIVDKFMNVVTNQSLVINEGQTLVCELTVLGSVNPCEGDTVVLDAGVWDSYLWHDGSTERYFSVTSDLECYVVAYYNGLEAASEVIQIDFTNADDFSIVNLSGPCINSEDGLVTLEIQDANSNTISSVLWNNSLVANQFVVAPNSNVVYSFETENSCLIDGDSLLEHEGVFSVEISSEILDESASCPNEWYGYADIVGGESPFSFDWEFYYLGEAEPFLEHSNYYFQCIDTHTDILVSLRLTDANGCQLNKEKVLQNPLYVDIKESKLSVNLWPNPFNNMLLISSFFNRVEVTLFDIAGKLQGHYFIHSGDNNINTNHLAPGIYFMEINQNNAKEIRKLIKQ